MTYRSNFVAASLITVFLIAGCQSSSKSPGTAAANDTEQMTLVVQGLSCPLCAQNVDKQLMTVDGIVDARVNLSDGTVLVRYKKDQRPSRERLDRIVSDAGFSLKEVK